MRRLRLGRHARPESDVSFRADNDRQFMKCASRTTWLVLIGARSERNSSKFSPVDGPVAKGPISDFALRRHLREHWLVPIDVVVNDNVAFRRVQAMKTAGILREYSAPRNRHGQEQGVEPRIIETLAEIGGVSPNPRKFRQAKLSPATIASRFMACPLLRKV